MMSSLVTPSVRRPYQGAIDMLDLVQERRTKPLAPGYPLPHLLCSLHDF
jgi:hypothetical protein